MQHMICWSAALLSLALTPFTCWVIQLVILKRFITLNALANNNNSSSLLGIKGVTVRISIMPLHSGALTDLTSHLAGPTVSKSLEIMQRYNREGNHLLVITLFINNNIHYTFIIIYLEGHTLRHWQGYLCNKFKKLHLTDDLIKIGDSFNITYNLTLKICIQR